ncbi:MAG: DNA-formamidopyrimidine glycosylase [Erysipelotrichales bacterium]|nr:DNA-formamidopyrimidine glycosylase [Erysipelotrichales bacterium]
MPELAEVRTVARTLNERIVGKKIIGVDTPFDKIIEGDKKAFVEGAINSYITNVDNYGKWIFISLGSNTIMAHLRMEGKFFIKPQDEKISKHEHIIFHLDDGTDLRYHDVRKFGKMILVKTDEIYRSKEIAKLGIEPDNKALSAHYIHECLKSKKMPIKTALLDQTIINGLGNIYADEVLFASGINPLREACSIKLTECESIKNAASAIITKATEMGGTTIRSYTSSLGVYGNYQSELKVHTKQGVPCQVCGSEIKKTRVGGRGTYYCPKCQK